jgi:spore coat polysaccharide biosynthesis protein SpsF
MSNAIFITVRTSSTRLPTKALIPLYGEVTLVKHIISRAKLSKLADRIVLCTTSETADDQLCEIAKSCGIDFFRGPTEDKLLRWNQAAEHFNVEFIATFDGDDPFCSPELIDLAFEQIQRDSVDFIESAEIATGAFTYALRASALKKVCEIKDSEDTEMMWTYFKDTGLFKIAELHQVPLNLKNAKVRLTLDYPEDLQLFREIFGLLKSDHTVDLSLVIELLMSNDSLREMNFFRQGDFLANQARNTHLKIRGVSD